MDVIGVGTAKRQYVGLALCPGLLQMVLELAPLVAGQARVNEIVPFAPERDPMGRQQRVVDPVQGGGKLQGVNRIASGGRPLVLQGIVCHKVGG